MYISVSLGISQFMVVVSSHMLRTEKLNHLDHLQHDFYVDISFKFTLEYRMGNTCVSCMYMNKYVLCVLLVLFT